MKARPFFLFFFKEKTPQKRRVGNREKKLESRKEGEEKGSVEKRNYVERKSRDDGEKARLATRRNQDK